MGGIDGCILLLNVLLVISIKFYNAFISSTVNALSSRCTTFMSIIGDLYISYTPHRRCLWNLETEGEARGFQIP